MKSYIHLNIPTFLGWGAFIVVSMQNASLVKNVSPSVYTTDFITISNGWLLVKGLNNI